MLALAKKILQTSTNHYFFGEYPLGLHENLKHMNYPDNLLYTKDHEWVAIEGDVATIGITYFAQSELGDIVFVEIETEGEALEAEAIFGSVEAVKTVSDLFMPVAGEVIEVNPEITTSPELVNSDPYGAGWMIKVRLSDENREHLMSAADYKNLIGA
jgi:glycine cleavage system H protein